MQPENLTGTSNLSIGSENLQDRYATLVDLYARFKPSILLIDRSVTPLWYCLGLFGNLLSAYVWMNPRVRKNNSSAVYLAALSVWDLLFLALHPVQEVQEAWMGVTGGNLFICSVIHVPLLTAQYLSPVLVLCFTIERWIAIWFPFRRDALCTPRRALLVTASMAVCVLLWNTAQLHFRTYDAATDSCVTMMNSFSWRIYTAITEAIFSGVVPVTALVFNVMVVVELHRITVGSKNVMPTGDSGDSGTERRFRSTTVMLLCVSFFVILTTLPAGLMYAFQNQDYGSFNLTDKQVLTDEQWRKYFDATLSKKIVDEISISHYSLNFLIYLLTGPQYRIYARQLLAKLTRPLLQCCGGQRRQKLRQREHYYLTNSRTDRSKRLAASSSSRQCEEWLSQDERDGQAEQQANNGAAEAALSEAAKPLLLTESLTARADD